MSDSADMALLPEGLRDGLPPDAGHEADVIERLIATMAGYGYERVKPPLIEFEESLLAGPGAGLGRQIFRLMDPISQRMMGVRADMTTQVARIASTRLRNRPRPLRLSYGGQALRVRGSQLRPERQYAQAGAEQIGADTVAGDAEIVSLAVDALSEIGVKRLSLDLTLPALAPRIAAAVGLDPERTAEVRETLNQKHRAALADLDGPARALFEGLIDAAGPADRALAALAALPLPDEAAAMRQRLVDLVAAIDWLGERAGLTVDPGESQGFAYQSGFGVTIFAKGVRGELGRGGRYRLISGESAAGFTLYLDSVMRALAPPARAARLFVPATTARAEVARLRAEGWQTVAAIDRPGAGAADEAVRLGCSHWWDGAAACAVENS